MRKFNGDKAMTCKECFHYEACKSMLEAMGYVVDGDGEYASLVCNEFQAAADVVEVVRCTDCLMHGFCVAEEAFISVGIPNPYCCGGTRRKENAKAD